MGGRSALSAGEGATRRAENCGRERRYGVPAAKVGRGSAAVVKSGARPPPGDDGRAPAATGAADATAAAAIPSATASTHVKDSPGAGTGAQNSATVGNSGAAPGGGARAPPFATFPILKWWPRGDHRDPLPRQPPTWKAPHCHATVARGRQRPVTPLPPPPPPPPPRRRRTGCSGGARCQRGSSSGGGGRCSRFQRWARDRNPMNSSRGASRSTPNSPRSSTLPTDRGAPKGYFPFGVVVVSPQPPSAGREAGQSDRAHAGRSPNPAASTWRA